MSKLKLTTLATQDDSASVPADTIVNGTAKAWVNFDGTGTVAIRRAFNVSSVTDNGVGNYTVNFTSAMVDANYSVSGSIEPTSASRGHFFPNSLSSGSVTFQTQSTDSSGNLSGNDPNVVSVQIFS